MPIAAEARVARGIAIAASTTLAAIAVAMVRRIAFVVRVMSTSV
jgi:hypothetical protein